MREMKRKISIFLVSVLMGCMLTGVVAFSEEVVQNSQTTQLDMPSNDALVELYYSELLKQASKELLNEASNESEMLAVYYAALAMQNMADSSTYSKLAQYYRTVANTECVCMINGTYDIYGCTCGKNMGKEKRTAKKSNKSSAPKTSYSYDVYGYLAEGSTFIVRQLVLVKHGKYFVDQYGCHYCIDEADLVYGIDKIEKETGKVYTIEPVEYAETKHEQALMDKNYYNLWKQLKDSE
ncbi:MAG: hypothetical protein MJ133_08095 [Lachnospiraceae bacterium]|nr:hypothetical protein [Lachnospiraceae bacterium]